MGAYSYLLRIIAFSLAVSVPEFFRGRELIERYFAGYSAAGAGSIMFKKSIAVGTVGEWDIKNLGVFKGLLHACANGVVVVLGFDNS